jgi:predicted nuclease of predicted toxin-antitoxin system
MLVKLDEPLSGSLAARLQASQYAVATVITQGWGGLKDPILWPRIKAEGAFFITADKGFSDIRSYPPGTHPGILVLRPERESILAYGRLLDSVLQQHRLETLAGCISVATPSGLRVRRPTP